MAASLPLPLVGRAHELKLLSARASDPSGAPKAVQIVRGAAGVGKTRLVREALQAVGTPTIWVRCWDDSTAMWPWLQVLGKLELESAPPIDNPDRLARFSDILRRLRRVGPLVIVLDDLHVADPESLLFTRFLARSEPRGDLLVVATHRPLDSIDEVRATALEELARESDEMHLQHLDPAASVELLAAAGVNVSDKDLLDALVSLTNGLPLAIERAAASTEHTDLRRTDRTRLHDLSATVDMAGRALTPLDRRVLAGAALYGGAPLVSDLVSVLAGPLGVDTGAVLHAIHGGREAGLVTQGADDLVFVHDLVADAVARWANPIDRVAVHRSAAALLATRGADWLPLAASHATALAGVDPGGAFEAVKANMAAARHHEAEGAYEAAEATYETAVGLAERLGLGVSPDLRLAHANASLAAGRLARARQLFGRAVAAADATGDVAVLADAAAGLGGIWVGEHRAEPAKSTVDALQRRALDAIAGTDAVRAARLRVRLAAERAYVTNDPGDIEAVHQTLAEIESLGDDRLLAEALSLTIHVHLGPADADLRLDLVERLTAAAARAADPLLLLVTECWRAVVFRLADDARSERARRSLAQRCDTVRCAGIQFILEAMEVGDLISKGRFEAAEAAAANTFELGQSVGDADAWNYYAAHLALLRWFQGRHAELADFADEAAASPSMTATERAMATTAAYFALDAGRPGPAEMMVVAHRRSPAVRSYQASTWCLAMFALAHLADGLGDAALGRDVVERLSPYRGSSVPLSIGIASVGPVDWAIGIAARAMGDLALAESALRTAIDDATRLEHLPARAIVTAELAALLATAEPPRLVEARRVIEQAIGDAERLGMVGWLPRWRSLLDDVVNSTVDVVERRVEFSRLDERLWRCRWGDDETLVADAVGVRHLAVLCSTPDTDVPATRLAYLAETHEATYALLDDRAIDLLRDRAAELRRRLDDGEGRRAQLEDELDAVTNELLAGLGLGSSRTFSDAGERARTSVRKAITRALDRLATSAPHIAAHLREQVSTGQTCRYRTR